MNDLFSVASKLGISSIYRIGLSGLIFAMLLLPVQNALVPEMLKIDELGEFVTIFVPEALILGMLLTLFRNVIYRVYEGRLLWPGWLHEAMTNSMKRRVLAQLAETRAEDISNTQYRELWFWLRMFPLDDQGDPTATRPTTLGNILDGYETYPDSRYGMDSIFYWYRLYPTLPESFTTHSEMASAGADTLMFASASAILSGMVYIILGWFSFLYNILPNWSLLSFTTALPVPGLIFGLAILYLILFFLFYRASIPLHRTNGEFYKAAFDLYRNNVKDMREISEEEKSKWHKTWTYLQYMYIQCSKCKKYYFVDEKKCPYCKTRKSKNLV